MKRSDVCPFICPCVCPRGPTAAAGCCCGPGGQMISIAARPALSSRGGRMRAVSRCQRTQEAEHRVVFFGSVLRSVG